MATSWSLSGDYFDSCNCAAACPCVFLSPPTTGECKALVAWHIERGTYGGEIPGSSSPAAVRQAGALVAQAPEYRGAIRRDAEEIIAEVAAARITERGASRADDRRSEAAMEDRKREGYF